MLEKLQRKMAARLMLGKAHQTLGLLAFDVMMASTQSKGQVALELVVIADKLREALHAHGGPLLERPRHPDIGGLFIEISSLLLQLSYILARHDGTDETTMFFLVGIASALETLHHNLTSP